MEVKSEIQWSFTMVKNAILDDEMYLSVIDKMVYICLSRFMNLKSGECHPSVARLAKMARVSDRSVRRSLKTLEEYNLISVIHRKKEEKEAFDTNRYILREIPVWFEGTDTVSVGTDRESVEVLPHSHQGTDTESDKRYVLNENQLNNKTYYQQENQFKQLYELFHQTFGYEMTPLQTQEINTLIDDRHMQPELLLYGIKKTGIAGKHSFSYTMAIYRSWLSKGILTLKQAEEEDRIQIKPFRKPPERAKPLYSQEELGW